VLRLRADVYRKLVAHCLDGLPEEACGLLAGPPGTSDAVVCYPTTNAEASARTYRVEPREQLQADRDAEGRGLEIIGAFHSHTHTDAYPSATDVEQAYDPGLHYVLVSLRHGAPVVRSYRIEDGTITEEPVSVDDL
jgi:proteasome lid subunit RPN8/RPN11